MTIAYDIVSLPIEAALSAANLVTAPIHFSKTMTTNVVETALKVIGTNTEDTPETRWLGNDSVYEMANTNLDIAGLIYYYTELRSETRRLLKAFALKKGVSCHVSDPNEPSDLILLYNAVKYVAKCLQTIKSPEATATVEALEAYKTSVLQLDGLRKKLKLDVAEMEVIEAYFEILSEPKQLTEIKKDVILFDKFIDPLFRVAFGGTDYNKTKIQDLIEADKGIYIHKIDDDFTTSTIDPVGTIQGFKSELVWAIVVCKAEKTITVVFRGSVNAADWVSNVQCNMCDYNIPGFVSKHNRDKSQNFGRVHEGFYKYLFEETMAGSNGSTKSKGEEIMGTLQGDFFSKPEYKDYKLFVTGHSLGGAISTLFSFRAAAFNELNRPVVNVSFASPFVGNDLFRAKFIDLERKKQVQHLRVSNYQDVVTLIPSLTFPLPEGVKPYKHVGMNIRLYSNDLGSPNYRRFYPKEGSLINGMRNTLHGSIMLGLSTDPIGHHLTPEYTKRLNSHGTKKELSKLSLDDLYMDSSITGWSYY